MHRRSILVLYALFAVSAGCVGGGPDGPTDQGDVDSTVGEGNGTMQTTFFLLFPPECSDGEEGYTTYNSTEDGMEHRCGRSTHDQIVSPDAPCASFDFHDDAFDIVRGSNITAEIVIDYFTTDEITPRIVLRNDTGVIAEATSEPQRTTTPTGGRGHFETLAAGDGEGPVTLDVYVDGGLCQGVWTEGSRESSVSVTPPAP